MRLYNLSFPIIGITGGVASGKSTVSNYFKKSQQVVLSADEIIKIIYQEEETIKWLQTHYPQYLKNNIIQLKELSADAFRNKELLSELEQFLYPKMERVFKSLIPIRKPLRLFYEIPLLFEKKKEKEFDSIILITCSRETQIERVIKRNNISKEKALEIINTQMPFSEKIEMANFIIDNSKDEESLYRQCHEVLHKIQEKYK